MARVQSSPPRVVVVGSVNVDLVVVAAALPGPGETVLGERLDRHGGGKGANAAVAAARLGADVSLVAAVGTDDLGRQAVDELAAEGVRVDHVRRLDDVPTGAALIVVDAGGENQIAVGAGANGRLGRDLVAEALEALLDGADVVLVSCEIPLAGVGAAVSLARAAGVQVLLNPAPPAAELLAAARGGAILTPNATEAAALAGEPDPAAAARALARRTDAAVVVTLGGDGVLLQAGPDAEPERLPAVRVESVVDTTGAGDTFNGALAVELAAGRDLPAAVAFAQRAAGEAVQAAGARAGMPRREAVAA
jgi:ribokinase